jgi:hypothetical protein
VRELHTGWRAQKILDPALRVDFVYPSVEPLVWLPDVVCGAVGEALDGTDDRYRTRLGALLREQHISLG